MTANKKLSVETLTGIITIALTVLGAILFFLGFSTGYYILGQMQSVTIAALLGGAILLEIFVIFALKKWPGEFWPKLLTFGVTAMLAAAAMLLVGDRVEGIGNCIVTDYDSGHGGEEAIYFSLGGVVMMLLGMIFNLIGSFSAPAENGGSRSAGKAKTVGFSVSAAVLAVAALIATLNLAGVFGAKTAGGAQGGAAPGAAAGGVYTVSYNANNGNADEGVMPHYQFLCSDLSGMVRADSRFFVDLQLELDGAGNYTLSVDSYVKEGDYRSVIGDDTGLGLVLTTNAVGTYVDNGDGTVTTSVPSHAVFVMETDTYSQQMKGAAQMNVNGNDADGTYDSNDEPAVLDFVPETVWTLSGSEIVSYRNASLGGTYTVSFNANSGNVEDMPDYQFLCSNLSGMLKSDSRFFVDMTLTLDGSGHYTLAVDSYVKEGEYRSVIGDDTGLGLVLTMNAEGTYTENADGSYTTAVPNHAVFEMETDTYSSQLKGAAQMNVNGNDADGVYDSNDEPAVLDFVPETVWTLDQSGKAIVSWARADAESTEEPSAEEAQGATIPSDDGATAITFYPDGSYKFSFEAYGVEETGSYTYENGVLTLTNPNGAEAVAEGDPLLLHYVTAVSDQLAGDYTIPTSTFDFGAGEAAETLAVIPSDDGGTEMSFFSDGTYRFWFEAYSIEDLGTWTFADGVLTLTDVNGVQYTGEGDPIALHYGYSGAPDQLTGEYTIPASTFDFAPAGEVQSVTIVSDDEGTAMTFNSNGTYRFDFESYGIVDEGTWTYEDGVLTVTDVNGTQYTADGDPLHLHYGYSGAPDQLTGEYTIPADTFDFDKLLSLTVLSDDRGTSMTFNGDGTYRFWFEAYSIEDLGTWEIADGVLTVTDANGKETKAEGAPFKLHYVYSMSDQLTGDYTIPVGVFPLQASGTSIPSDDFGTGLTFFEDSTYLFTFDSYSILDAGTWTFENGVLTLTDANGVTYTAEGETLKLHYGFSGAPDQLTGDFTIDPAIFAEKTEK